MKKLISATLAATLALSLAACGSSASTSEAAPAESTASSAAESAAESTAETSELAGTTLKVAASPTPHAEILNVAKEVLAEQGIDLQVVEFSDYVQPNLVTESGEVDANYFQHTPYLDSFNEENGTHLVSVGAVHYEPFGIYPGKSSDLANIADGATIAVPNDTTNEARALQLLAAQGLITVRDGAGLTATVNDTAQRRWWLLSFGSKVEVLEPAGLREEMANQAYWMNRLYARASQPLNSPNQDFRFSSFPRMRESSRLLKRMDTRFRGYDGKNQVSESPESVNS